MNLRNTSYAILLVLTGVLYFGRDAFVRGQDDTLTTQESPVIGLPGTPMIGQPTKTMGYVRIATGESIVQKAVRKYQSAETEEVKEEAKKEMSSALSEYFDADLKNREQEIKNIESRIQKLRAQLKKREAAKKNIVDLQLKVLINEAEGLGFYSRPNSGLDFKNEGIILKSTRSSGFTVPSNSNSSFKKLGR